MKTLFAYTLASALALSIIACGNDDKPADTALRAVSGTIADMPEGTGYTLSLLAIPTDDNDNDNENEEDMEAFVTEYLIASSSVSSGGAFSVNLPADVDPKYFMSYERSLAEMLTDTDDMTIAVSNTDFNIAVTTFALLDKDGVFEGGLRGFYRVGHPDYPKGYVAVGWLFYADGNSTITGYSSTIDPDSSFETTISIDLNIKKGWNWFCQERKETETTAEGLITSTPPAGLQLASI